VLRRLPLEEQETSYLAAADRIASFFCTDEQYTFEQPRAQAECIRLTGQPTCRILLAEGFDLTHSQYVLLLDLFDEDGQSQQRLAGRVFKDKAAIKRTVDTLVAKGLVERGEASRNNPVRLTERARDLEPRLRAIATENVRQATRGVPPQEIEACAEVLRRLHRQLAEDGEDC